MTTDFPVNQFFPSKFRKERKRLHMTQEEFGPQPIDEILQNNPPSTKIYRGIADRRTVRKWENGTALPNVKTALRLCELFDCDLDYLFTEQKERRKETRDAKALTGLDTETAEKLRRKAISGYWPALNAVLQNETFWQFLKLMESFKIYQSKSDDHLGQWIQDKVDGAARAMLPNPTSTDREIAGDQYLMSMCSFYCTKLVDDYCKEESKNGEAKE